MDLKSKASLKFWHDREKHRDIHDDEWCLRWLKSKGSLELPEDEVRRVKRRAARHRWDEATDEVYMITLSGKEVRIPKPADRLALVKEYHARTGHWGIRRTQHLLWQRHWWADLKKDVEAVVTQCDQEAVVPPDLKQAPNLDFDLEVRDDKDTRGSRIYCRKLRWQKTRRGGGYEPKPHQFKVGDFVYIRQKPRSGMEVATKSAILKLVTIQRDDVAVLEDAAKLKEKSTVQSIAPCHLQVKD
eukprot:gene17073-biopygen17623